MKGINHQNIHELFCLFRTLDSHNAILILRTIQEKPGYTSLEIGNLLHLPIPTVRMVCKKLRSASLISGSALEGFEINHDRVYQVQKIEEMYEATNNSFANIN